MKLRLKGNSIRFRLTQGEVERLRTEGAVEEIVDFGFAGGSFGYRLEISKTEPTVRAEYSNGCIRVLLPDQLGNEWFAPGEVGIDTDQDDLRIVIEKDFACTKPRAGEDESDMFPNPETR